MGHRYQTFFKIGCKILPDVHFVQESGDPIYQNYWMKNSDKIRYNLGRPSPVVASRANNYTTNERYQCQLFWFWSNKTIRNSHRSNFYHEFTSINFCISFSIALELHHRNPLWAVMRHRGSTTEPCYLQYLTAASTVDGRNYSVVAQK